MRIYSQMAADFERALVVDNSGLEKMMALLLPGRHWRISSRSDNWRADCYIWIWWHNTCFICMRYTYWQSRHSLSFPQLRPTPAASHQPP